jgi:hypothetical protein
MENKTTNSGISLTSVLFIVFLVLKLTGNINWSWWWVTSPLWIPFAIVLSTLFIIFAFVSILYITGNKNFLIKLRDKMKKEDDDESKEFDKSIFR